MHLREHSKISITANELFILQVEMPPQRRAKTKATGSRQRLTEPLTTSQHQRRGRRASKNVPSLQSPTTDSAVPVTNVIPESLVDDILQRVVEKLSTKLPVVNQSSSRGESSSAGDESSEENAASATTLVDSSISAMQAVLTDENSSPSIPELLFTSPSLPIDARVSDKVKPGTH